MTSSHTSTLYFYGVSVPVTAYDDGNVWVDHPRTGIRVGVGRNDDGQPFVCINTEQATDAEVEGEPVVNISLNDAEIYDVESTGPTQFSIFHQKAHRAISDGA